MQDLRSSFDCPKGDVAGWRGDLADPPFDRHYTVMHEPSFEGQLVASPSLKYTNTDFLVYTQNSLVLYYVILTTEGNNAYVGGPCTCTY